MSSINSALGNAYYQLSNLASGASGSPQGAPASLAQALSAASGTSSSSDAYLLDLSPQAQQYMASANATSAAAPQAISGATGSFVLSTQQQQQITAILQKYADAPPTQATFDQIQNDLSAAGLGANQLAQQDQAKNFNTTQLLIDDLNGNYNAADALASSSSGNEQTKSANYMQQIISQWKNLSSSSAVAAAGGAGGA